MCHKSFLRSLCVAGSRSQSTLSSSSRDPVSSSPAPESNFARAKVGDFVQCEPRHENSFTSDSFLQSYLARQVPREAAQLIAADLATFGQRCASEIQVLGRQCELSPPYLVQT